MEHVKGRELQACSLVFFRARDKVSGSPCIRHFVRGFCLQHSSPSTSLTRVHAPATTTKRERIGTADSNKQVLRCAPQRKNQHLTGVHDFRSGNAPGKALLTPGVSLLSDFS